eukprot:360528-Chlamydomonas_euryale.AAC.1
MSVRGQEHRTPPTLPPSNAAAPRCAVQSFPSCSTSSVSRRPQLSRAARHACLRQHRHAARHGRWLTRWTARCAQRGRCRRAAVS